MQYNHFPVVVLARHPARAVWSAVFYWRRYDVSNLPVTLYIYITYYFMTSTLNYRNGENNPQINNLHKQNIRKQKYKWIPFLYNCSPNTPMDFYKYILYCQHLMICNQQYSKANSNHCYQLFICSRVCLTQFSIVYCQTKISKSRHEKTGLWPFLF